MKKLLLLLAFVLPLSADYLLTYDRGWQGDAKQCVEVIQYNQNNTISFRTSYNTVSTISVNDFISLETGYLYDSNNQACYRKPHLASLGLTDENYNFLIALTALLLGFITIFFMSYISIEVAKK